MHDSRSTPPASPASEPAPDFPAASAVPPTRDAYPHFQPLQTRWIDNDMYGHVNNVVYYAYFDSVITEYLIREGGLDVHAPDAPALYAVESFCRFHRSLAFPDAVDAGLRVGHLGTTSARFELALFRANEPKAAAAGYFTVVLIDRARNKPLAFPPAMRAALARLQSAA